MHKGFEQIAFREPETAEKTLNALAEETGASYADHIPEALAVSPDPDVALARFERFLRATMAPRRYMELTNSLPRFAQMLLTVLVQSHYLTDILCRNPEYMIWLWEDAELDQARPLADVMVEVAGQLKTFDSFEAKCESLRRYKRREFLRIATRDVFCGASVVSVTEDLSNLADAALQGAIDSAKELLNERYGAPTGGEGEDAAFCVLAMGKLGGRELNFSSDIDLIFLFSEEGDTRGGTSGQVANVVYYQKLGEFVIKALSEATREGSVFRVDMRLRPYGKASPLAVSIERAIDYYESVGQAWERQALVKGRPCAGDVALGYAFLDATRPFVYPRYFDDETLEEIRQIKQQAEAQVQRRSDSSAEVKLGPGGIRDVEFTVQVLQLLNGGRFEDLRTANTLDAITALREHELLTPFEADTLSSNYVFMRQVEHRLQIEGSQQRHALPSSPEALEDFARRLGYASAESFMKMYEDRAETTRDILMRFLATEGAGYRWINDLLHPWTDGEIALTRLSELGFEEPAKACDELIDLYAGPMDRPHTSHVRHLFTAVAPGLIEALSACSRPDAALRDVARILTNLRASGAIYGVLKGNPKLCDYLVRLVVNSRFLTDILTRDPGLFDMLGAPGALDQPTTRDELVSILESLTNAYDAEAAVYRLHAGETLRIGVRDLVHQTDVFEVGEELTLLAEVCLQHVMEEAREATVKRHGSTGCRFAVLALGKMGGREMGYGSDLDLVFVHEDGGTTTEGLSAHEFYIQLGAHVMRMLKEPTRYGTLYDVDVRLRPDGSKGELSISLSRLTDYYAGEAQPWERLALAKARAVGGDPEFAEEVARRAREFAFGVPLSAEGLANVRDMSEKLSASASPMDLKRSQGGLAPLEFAIRVLQIRHGESNPDLWCADIRTAIKALRRHKLLEPPEAAMLSESYILYRRIENRLRMMEGRSASTLPEDPDVCADLADRLGIEGDLLERVEAAKERVFAFYTRTLEEAAGG